MQFGGRDSPRRVAFDEHSQHFPRSAYRAVHDPAAALEARDKVRGRPVWTKDVPELRTDHVSIKGKLLGVWQSLYGGRVLDFKEMNRRLVRFPRISHQGRAL
jgi:hypothetical protein